MDKVTAQKRFLEAANMSVEDLLEKYETSEIGILDEDIVEKNRDLYGENVLDSKKKVSVFRRIGRALIDPFTVILLVLASISFVLDVLMASKGDKDISTVVIIIVMIIISVFLKVYQETKSETAVSALTSMINVSTAVRRNNITVERPLEEVVVGDVIALAAGDIIPGDARIIAARDLFLSEASLTGESEPVEKSVYSKKANDNLLARSNLVFMGTNVISGSGVAVTIAVGKETFFGDISKAVTQKADKTSFEIGIASVSWLLIRFMLVMIPFVILINGFGKGDWIGSVLFALSIAVGLTPEMLPMIVTTSLSKGAVSMSKKDVIVKDLSAIQNLGAIDILCTDKTGTLTENRVVVEYHHNVHGEEEPRVLRHGFLNSYYQTGLRNLIDKSIIEKTNRIKDGEPLLRNLEKNYKKIDELPFDFKRKRMSVILEDKNGKVQMITKGAVEGMLSICDFVEYENKVLPLTDNLKKIVLKHVNELNDRGMRVIAVAQRTNEELRNLQATVADEKEMVLMGYLSFLDPVKESAEEAIRSLEHLGIDVKVLTGDNERVTKEICRRLHINTENVVLGPDLSNMTDEEVRATVKNTNVYAKLAPLDKARLVQIMRDMGHVVGFLGDGINDAPAMKVADVGISVHDAVDIAKETAPVILLEKDLNVLRGSIRESRTVYMNMLKYIKITASSNFGNMFSVIVASLMLPFLPMLPLHLLLLNLIYDISMVTIPWDNVDEEQIAKPLPWETGGIRSFMVWFGPISSIFDIALYVIMFFFLLPNTFGGSFKSLLAGDQAKFIMMFHAAWFILSMISQTLIVHLIRSEKTAFVKSRASWQLMTSAIVGTVVLVSLPYLFGPQLNLLAPPAVFYAILTGLIAAYVGLTILIKKIYIKKYGKLI